VGCQETEDEHDGNWMPAGADPAGCEHCGKTGEVIEKQYGYSLFDNWLFIYLCPGPPSSITTRLGLRNQPIEPVDKILFIDRIAKNFLSFDPLDDHVMQNPGRV
jgi:hypothetical protein